MYFGGVSYSTYLIHWSLCAYMLHASSALRTNSPPAVIYTLLTLGLAYVLHRGIEQPSKPSQNIWCSNILSFFYVTVFICALGVYTNGFESRALNHFNTGFPRSENMRMFQSFTIGDVNKNLTNRSMGSIARVGNTEFG